MALNSIDIVILICLIPAIVGGITKGFVRQASAFFALIIGIWLAYHFASLVSTSLLSWIKVKEELLNIISFAVIFLAVLFLINVVGKIIQRVLQFAMLGWVDKIAGVILALFKYAFIISIVIYISESLNTFLKFMPEESIKESILYDPISKIAPTLFPFLKNLISKI